MTNVTRSSVEAAWARIGKVPGEREDYHILASSRGPINVSLYCEEFQAGHPPSDPEPPAARTPLWATFGVHRDPSGMPLVSVSVQLWWEGRDQARRPIWPRNFFAFKYTDTAAHRLSYRALYEAVNPVELPAQVGQPGRDGQRGRRAIEASPGDRMLAYRPGETRSDWDGSTTPAVAGDTQQYLLHVEQASSAGLVAAVSRFGFEWLAGVAAALLDGPVAISGTADLRLADRLDLLDAIAALLPYGFRADLSASSGVSETSAPNMRLIFTEDAFDHHRTVYLGHPSAVELTPLAGEYQSTLLRKAGAARPEAARLERVIAHQLQGASACSFEHPEMALAWLTQLDRRSDLIRKLASGKLDLRDIVEFADEPAEVVAAHWENLPLPRRHQIVGLLADSRNDATGRALAKLWGIAFPEIVESAVERLNQGQTDRAAWSLQVAESSRGLDEADRLLTYLLIPGQQDGRGGSAESWRSRMDACVRLLLQRSVPATGAFSQMLMVLPLGRATDWPAVLVRTLLTSELDHGVGLGEIRVREWLSWFHGSAHRQGSARPHWAAALDLVAGTPSGAQRITTLVTSESPAWAGPLVRLAASSGSLIQVLGDLGTHIIALAVRECADGGQQTNQEGLSFALAGSFRSAGVPPEMLAIVDAARAILGIEMIDCPSPQSETFERYRGDKGIGEVFRTLADQLEWSAVAEAAFLTRVLRLPANGRDPLPPAAIKLIGDWCADQSRAPGLARHIDRSEEDALVGTLLHFDQLSPDQWRTLARYVPRFGPLASAAQLRKAVNQTIWDPRTELARETTGAVSDLGQDGLEGDHRTWRGGVSNSSLATAMYNARLDGMEIPQILAVLHGAQVRSSSGQPMRLTERTEPSQIWDVLREFQSQLHHRPLTGQQRILSREQAQAEAQRDLRHCLDLIIYEGALGVDYAETFWHFYREQERRSEQIHHEERKRYRRGPRRHGRHANSLGPTRAPDWGGEASARADGREATAPRPDQRQFQQQGSVGASSGDGYPGYVHPPRPAQHALPSVAPGTAGQPPQPSEQAQPGNGRPRRRLRGWLRRRIVLTGNIGAPPSNQQDQRL